LNDLFILHVDASNVGLGGVLLQADELLLEEVEFIPAQLFCGREGSACAYFWAPTF
jgi:hypothetical protein